MPKILNKFTTHLKKTLKEAENLAISQKSLLINPAHLLFCLMLQKGSLATEILLKAGLGIETLKKSLFNQSSPAPSFSPTPTSSTDTIIKPKFSPDSKRVLAKAVLIANKYHHKYVGTEHLLYGLIKADVEAIKKILAGSQINGEEIEQHLTVVLKGTSKFPDLTEIFSKAKELEEEPLGPKRFKSPALDFFCVDLTNKDLQKRIDPVIGRQKEITRLIHILSRRTKNNPVLIGDPGVGKTAIVEGLAKKILKGEVPDILLNKKILNLDLSLLVAGTIYRGEFESRIKQVIEEIKADPNIILFIDELHNIIGAGGATGAMDAANILKPALAKGEIHCIGATTLDEYRKHIESDAALERRFQPIIVEESTPEETIEILKGTRPNYEKYHRVAITDEAIAAAVKLSTRYLQDKFLPDKAIDLIDEAASKIKINQKVDTNLKEVRELEKEISMVADRKQKAVRDENFQLALKIKDQEETLNKKLWQLKEKMAKEEKVLLGQIGQKDIAEVIARITGVPLEELVSSEKEKLLNLEKLINQKIIGQEEVVKAVTNFIRRSRVGLSHPNRPIGSFMFLGPSGVGKTELAKVIAKVVFEDPNALIRIDMSEFAEGFNISKLIGAPAGYVGYKEGGKLTDSVKRKPYSVVLFDEIEKAHPEVFNLLLQVLEDGHLTDAVGKKINFKNTIIIMTSNVGLSNLNKAAIGFADSKSKDQKTLESHYQEIKNQVLKEIEGHFKPEFLNRIDKVVVFKPLNLPAIEKIVGLQLEELTERLETNNEIKLETDNRVKKFIAAAAFTPDQGARAVRKTIQELIENPLAGKILEGVFTSGDTAKAGVKNKKVILEK